MSGFTICGVPDTGYPWRERWRVPPAPSGRSACTERGCDPGLPPAAGAAERFPACAPGAPYQDAPARMPGTVEDWG